MSRRSEIAVIAYTMAVVLLGFVQFAHEVWDGAATATTTTPVTLMASKGAPDADTQ